MIVPVFITVRTSSTRLPKKCLLPFGEVNVLEHIIRRSKHYDLEPVVCTTKESNDGIIEKISGAENVRCYRGSSKNKLKRWFDCCKEFNIEAFHSVDADDPFFDGNLVKKSFEMLLQGVDIVYPTESSSRGSGCVGYSITRDILAKTLELSQTEDTEMIWYFIEKVPGLKKSILRDENPVPLKLRLTLDYEEDYWLLSMVQRLCGNYASRQEVEDLFRRNPDLYKFNWFRNDEWQQGQVLGRVHKDK